MLIYSWMREDLSLQKWCLEKFFFLDNICENTLGCEWNHWNVEGMCFCIVARHQSRMPNLLITALSERWFWYIRTAYSKFVGVEKAWVKLELIKQSNVEWNICMHNYIWYVRVHLNMGKSFAAEIFPIRKHCENKVGNELRYWIKGRLRFCVVTHNQPRIPNLAITVLPER